MVLRVCHNCGVPYETPPSIRLAYCGQRCANAAKRCGRMVPCEQCGEDFYVRPSEERRGQRYCSKSCARTAANLTDRNPAFRRDISGENNPMYGKGLSGPNNPMYGKRREQAPAWKGGRKIRRDGYVLVVAPDDHPYPADVHPGSGLKYILEHRYVMEQHIGRYLEPSEVVHHRDGNPTNNAITNLELFASQAAHMHVGHSG